MHSITLPWNLCSRVQALNQYPNEHVTCYAKRDDELGCGISGTKLRKYSSLIPLLMQRGIKHLIIIAGPQSNNLLAALQMAREHQFKVTAFLLKPWKIQPKGNFKLSLMFLEEKDIVWVDRDNWAKVEDEAIDYADSLTEAGFVLSEGASVLEALSGAMTLAEDIVRNEQQLGLQFDHIFVDAGTGFSAAALIKGLELLKHPATVYVLLLADDIATFELKLENWLGETYTNYRCILPTTAKSFGASNATIQQEIIRLAKEEGILADPVYAAKLFYEARQYITVNQLSGKVLIIHSGGTLSLAGF